MTDGNTGSGKFNYDESSNIITFYEVQFTIEAIDAVSEIFSLSDIIKTAKTKKTLVHVINDFEPDANTRQIIKDGGWSENK